MSRDKFRLPRGQGDRVADDCVSHARRQQERVRVSKLSRQGRRLVFVVSVEDCRHGTQGRAVFAPIRRRRAERPPRAVRDARRAARGQTHVARVASPAAARQRDYSRRPRPQAARYQRARFAHRARCERLGGGGRQRHGRRLGHGPGRAVCQSRADARRTRSCRRAQCGTGRGARRVGVVSRRRRLADARRAAAHVGRICARRCLIHLFRLFAGRRRLARGIQRGRRIQPARMARPACNHGAHGHRGRARDSV